MKYYYHGTTQERWEAVQARGYLKAPVFVFNGEDMATLFAERVAEDEDDTPVTLRLNLRNFRVYPDPTAPFIHEAHTVRQNVPLERIEELL